MRTLERIMGYREAVNDVLGLLQTYDSSLYSNAETMRGRIYKDVFTLEGERDISELDGQ